MVAKTKTVSLTIDGKGIKAVRGEKILWAALDNGIYIPKLCTIREQNEPLAACRLCFIESKKANPEPTGANREFDKYLFPCYIAVVFWDTEPINRRYTIWLS